MPLTTRRSPDGSSFLYLSVSIGTTEKHCTTFDDYAIVPTRKSFGVAAHRVVNAAAARPNARVNLTLRPGRGRGAHWCHGRYKLDLSVSYYTAPGPSSESIVLEEYPLTRLRIR